MRDPLRLRPLTEEEERVISKLARSQSASKRLVERAKIIQLAKEGQTIPFTSRFFIKPPPEPDEPWPSCFSFWEPKAWLATVPARSDPGPIHHLGSTSRRW